MSCWSQRGVPLCPAPSEHPPLFLLPQGMVLSAEYIKKKLEQEMVLSQAFGRDLVRHFPCIEPRVVVGAQGLG